MDTSASNESLITPKQGESSESGIKLSAGQ
jgi:hypothetical protein